MPPNNPNAYKKKGDPKSGLKKAEDGHIILRGEKKREPSIASLLATGGREAFGFPRQAEA